MMVAITHNLLNSQTHSFRQMRPTGAAGSDLEQGCGSARGDRTSVLATWMTCSWPSARTAWTDISLGWDAVAWHASLKRRLWRARVKGCLPCWPQRPRSAVAPAPPDPALSHWHARPPAAVNAGHFHPMPTAARGPAAAGYRWPASHPVTPRPGQE